MLGLRKQRTTGQFAMSQGLQAARGVHAVLVSGPRKYAVEGGKARKAKRQRPPTGTNPQAPGRGIVLIPVSQ